MTRTRKVTSIPGTYSFEGKSYGPFEAVNGKEFKEVPADFADALGLPLHESEIQAQAEQQEAEEGDLAAQVASLTTERDGLRAKLEEADSEISFLKLDVQNLTAQLEKAGAASPEAETSQQATPLAEDFPMRALLIEHGFDSLEKVKAGLATPDGAEKSPVENINGIGKKTVDAITAALG